MTSATVDRPEPQVAVGAWTADYLAAGETERRLVAAAGRCIARWGIRKTSLEDIAREAGVSRATAYRAFPGGKDRVVEAVVCHEIGCLLQALDADLRAAPTLEDLLVIGLSATLRVAVDHEVLGAVIRHEPELVLPHFAFHQLGRLLDLADAVCRPQLSRFLPAGQVRPAAELLARIALSYGFRPAAWVDPHDPASIRHLVRTYLMPALGRSPDTPTQENR
ncbi:MAG TPA: TetR/AcrR family transcriptional regulator [Acidimicrobiales bacterium]